MTPFIHPHACVIIGCDGAIWTLKGCWIIPLWPSEVGYPYEGWFTITPPVLPYEDSDA